MSRSSSLNSALCEKKWWKGGSQGHQVSGLLISQSLLWQEGLPYLYCVTTSKRLTLVKSITLVRCSWGSSFGTDMRRPCKSIWNWSIMAKSGLKPRTALQTLPAAKHHEPEEIATSILFQWKHLTGGGNQQFSSTPAAVNKGIEGIKVNSAWKIILGRKGVLLQWLV